jgi:hypothetical protein
MVRPFVEQFWFNFAVVKGSPGSRPSNTSTAKPAMDTPSYGLPAPRALEAVVAFVVHHGPRRLVDRHMIDLPRRLARDAEQEGERVFAADWQQHGWLDLDRPSAAADGSSVPDLGATEAGRRETAVAEMLCHGVDGPMLVAAGAIDLRLEPEGGYLAERRERQRVEHPAKIGAATPVPAENPIHTLVDRQIG